MTVDELKASIDACLTRGYDLRGYSYETERQRIFAAIDALAADAAAWRMVERMPDDYYLRHNSSQGTGEDWEVKDDRDAYPGIMGLGKSAREAIYEAREALQP